MEPHPSAFHSSSNAVRRISLTDFRSYSSLTLTLERQSVILTGANGAGKTNLLEAISFLAPGRGLRRSRLVDVTRRDKPDPGAMAWAVASTVDTLDGPVRIGTGLETSPNGERETGRRIVYINGEPARNHAILSEILGLVWVVPELDRLFTDSTTTRRRFLDHLVAGFDPSHTTRLGQYERTMRERNSLLRNSRLGIRTADQDWLNALERRMAECGVALSAARRDFIRRFTGIQPARTVFPRARVTLVGDTEHWLDEVSALEAEDRLRNALLASRDRDCEAGRTLFGPHRCDMAVAHLEKNTDAAFCSTGEQKALVIGILLVYTRLLALDRGATPLLLLDEIGAHLDARRRIALFAEIHELGAQAWMTGSDISLFEGFDGEAQYLHVENSNILQTRN